MKLCKNCHQPVQNKFCSQCGQRTSVARISLSSLIRDLPHAIFHVDRGFFYNLSELFKRPGMAITNYIEGKRKTFYHPATYLVISLILNYIIVKLYNLHFYDEVELSGMNEQTAKAIRDYDAMQWWFLEHTYIYILFAICASAIFLYSIYKIAKLHFNIAETAVAVLFIIAQGVIIQTLIYTFFGWIHSGPLIRTIEMVNTSILIIYASLVNYQLLRTIKSKLGRLILSAVAGFGLAIVWIGVAYLLYSLLH